MLLSAPYLGRVGRVAMLRIANPPTSVRLRDAPPFKSNQIKSNQIKQLSRITIIYGRENFPNRHHFLPHYIFTACAAVRISAKSSANLLNF